MAHYQNWNAWWFIFLHHIENPFCMTSSILGWGTNRQSITQHTMDTNSEHQPCSTFIYQSQNQYWPTINRLYPEKQNMMMKFHNPISIQCPFWQICVSRLFPTETKSTQYKSPKIKFHLSIIHGNNIRRLNAPFTASSIYSRMTYLLYIILETHFDIIHVRKLKYYDIKQANTKINIQHQQSHQQTHPSAIQS